MPACFILLITVGVGMTELLSNGTECERWKEALPLGHPAFTAAD